MVNEEKQPIEEHDEEEEEEDEDDEEDKDDTKKSFEDQFLDHLNAIVESQSVLVDSQKALSKTVLGYADRIKALETPTDLKLTPKGTAAGDDVGAKVTVPEHPYPQGQQAKLDADGDDIESGNKKLEIQGAIGKNFDFSTQTPRPNAALETVNKSYTRDYSQILKDARTEGYEGLSNIAKNILNGKYYVPSEEETFI